MRSLAVLERMAKQAVDHERRALQAIGEQMVNAKKQIEDLKGAIDSEAVAPLEFRTTGATLTTFIETNRQRIQSLEHDLCNLRRAHDTQMDRLRQVRTEQKRYELLTQRRARQRLLEQAAKEQKTIDEFVAIKAGRRRPARD